MNGATGHDGHCWGRSRFAFSWPAASVLTLGLLVAALDRDPSAFAQSVVSGPTAIAASVSLDALYGYKILATQTFVGQFRNDLGEAPGGFSVRFDIRLGPDQAMQWTVSHDRWVDTAKGRKNGHLQRSGKGILTKPGEARDGSGAGIWLFSGSTLTALRTFDVGGSKTDIQFKTSASGLTCEMQSPMMQQRGAGSTKDASAMPGGGKVEIIWSRMTTSTCRVDKI